MKGILEQIEESQRLKKLDNRSISEKVKEAIKLQQKNRLEKYKRIKDSLDFLEKKSKEMKKEIPLELYLTFSEDRDIGMRFYYKYKEWLSPITM